MRDYEDAFEGVKAGDQFVILCDTIDHVPCEKATSADIFEVALQSYQYYNFMGQFVTLDMQTRAISPCVE